MVSIVGYLTSEGKRLGVKPLFSLKASSYHACCLLSSMVLIGNKIPWSLFLCVPLSIFSCTEMIHWSGLPGLGSFSITKNQNRQRSAVRMSTSKWYSEVLMLWLLREGHCHAKNILKNCNEVDVSQKASLCSQLGVVPFGTGVNLRQVGRNETSLLQQVPLRQGSLPGKHPPAKNIRGMRASSPLVVRLLTEAVFSLTRHLSA